MCTARSWASSIPTRISEAVLVNVPEEELECVGKGFVCLMLDLEEASEYECCRSYC